MLKVGLQKIVLLALFSIAGTAVYAQNYQLHTVYIYSFIRYVQWPDDNGDFVIGVLGDSPIIEHLEKMAASKKAGARNIVVKKFSGQSEISKTHILFISKSSSDVLPQIKDKSAANHTLLITEKEGMGMQGSAINFVERNSKLAFELNKSSVDDAGLKVSSELTRLAIII